MIFILLALILISGLGVYFADGLDLALAATDADVNTTFTYQGQLTDGGVPANGSYDVQFQLFDAVSLSSSVSGTISKQDLLVTDGLFTTELNFDTVYDGTSLFLEIRVRPGSSTGSYTTLSPRQKLPAAPSGSYALSVRPHGHTGTTYGTRGFASATNGRRLYGRATLTIGGNIGVLGESNSNSGWGVFGNTTSTTGLPAEWSGSLAAPQVLAFTVTPTPEVVRSKVCMERATAPRVLVFMVWLSTAVVVHP